MWDEGCEREILTQAFHSRLGLAGAIPQLLLLTFGSMDFEGGVQTAVATVVSIPLSKLMLSKARRSWPRITYGAPYEAEGNYHSKLVG